MSQSSRQTKSQKNQLQLQTIPQEIRDLAFDTYLRSVASQSVTLVNSQMKKIQPTATLHSLLYVSKQISADYRAALCRQTRIRISYIYSRRGGELNTGIPPLILAQATSIWIELTKSATISTHESSVLNMVEAMKQFLSNFTQLSDVAIDVSAGGDSTKEHAVVRAMIKMLESSDGHPKLLVFSIRRAGTEQLSFGRHMGMAMARTAQGERWRSSGWSPYLEHSVLRERVLPLAMAYEVEP